MSDFREQPPFNPNLAKRMASQLGGGSAVPPPTATLQAGTVGAMLNTCGFLSRRVDELSCMLFARLTGDHDPLNNYQEGAAKVEPVRPVAGELATANNQLERAVNLLDRLVSSLTSG